MLDLKSLIPWGHKDDDNGSEVPVKREQVQDPFRSLRQEMDQLLDSFVSGWGGFSALPKTVSSEARAWFPAMPSVDVTDSENKLTVTAELPGVDEKNIEVTIEGEILTIRGEKKFDQEEKEGERYYRECRYGSFSRQIRLPFEAGDQEVSSNFKKGVLTIEIDKPAEAQSKLKRIPISS